jgi:hypothetical protein
MNFFLWLLTSVIVAASDGSVLDILSPDKRTQLARFGEGVGRSLAQLESGIEMVVEDVSELRGAPGTLKDVFIHQTIVLKIGFPDRRAWAAKWKPWADDRDALLVGIITLVMVKECCPNIPICEVEGWSIGDDSVSYFTAWVEGGTLTDLLVSEIATESEEGIRIPS